MPRRATQQRATPQRATQPVTPVVTAFATPQQTQLALLRETGGPGRGRMIHGVPLRVRLADIDIPAETPGESTSIAQLCDNIRWLGILHPPILLERTRGARHAPPPSSAMFRQYEVISGKRRLHAAMALGMDEVMASVFRNLTDNQVRAIRIAENNSRSTNPVEDFVQLRELLRNGVPLHDLCDQLGITPQVLARRMVFAALPASLQTALVSGVLRPRYALRMIRGLTTEQLMVLARYYTEDGGMPMSQVLEHATAMATTNEAHRARQQSIQGTLEGMLSSISTLANAADTANAVDTNVTQAVFNELPQRVGQETTMTVRRLVGNGRFACGGVTFIVEPPDGIVLVPSTTSTTAAAPTGITQESWLECLRRLYLALDAMPLAVDDATDAAHGYFLHMISLVQRALAASPVNEV